MSKLSGSALRKRRRDKMRRFYAYVEARGLFVLSSCGLAWTLSMGAEGNETLRVRGPRGRWYLVASREARDVSRAYQRLITETWNWSYRTGSTRMTPKLSAGKWSREQIEPSWIEADIQIVARMRAANLEDLACKQDRAGTWWVPYWAQTIAYCETLSERTKIAALRRAAYDREGGAALTTLLASVAEPREQALIVLDFVTDNEQTLVCPCGQKFTSAIMWRHHTEMLCKGPPKSAP